MTPPAPTRFRPAIVCGAAQTAGAGQPKVFVCWQDARHASTTNRDTDPYVVEVRDGKPRANVFVGDDGTNVNQSDPAIGVDHYGQPYVVWTDYRAAVTEVYSAATTLVDPTPLDSKTVVAAAGGTVGTDPAAIQRDPGRLARGAAGRLPGGPEHDHLPDPQSAGRERRLVGKL